MPTKRNSSKPIVRRKRKGLRKEIMMRFKVSAEQHFIIQNAANKEGLSMSAYIRQATLKAARAQRALEVQPELLEFLTKLDK